MAINETNLVWLDLEMTGLDPQKERILEMAIVVTDAHLEVIAQAPVWVLNQPDSLLNAMDDWNTRTHTRSGLVEKVKNSSWNEQSVQAAAIEFLSAYVPKGKVPMCGNTIGQDRRFLNAYMPELEAFFHYRNLDVSTLKELCKRWAPEIYRGFEKKTRHEALSDIIESIDEMKYYRTHFIRLPETTA